MATRRELAEAQRNLKTVLGREAVEAAKAEQELKRFTASTKSIADSYNTIAKELISSNIPLLKGIGSVAKTFTTYGAQIKVMQAEQAAQAKKLLAAQKAEEVARRKLRDAMSGSEAEQKKAAEAYKNKAIALETESRVTAQYALDIKKAKLTRFADTVKTAGNAMIELSNSLKQTQQQFGLMAGQSIGLRVDTFLRSVESTLGSLTSLGKTRAVSQKEIMGMQSSFQSEFGGILTGESAEKLAKEASRMGVSADQFTKARRTFLTQNMGNVVQAKIAQDKFIAEFTKKGLTSKDAMQAISQYSELLARNGSRFQQSFARAAVDAKKIGVDLSKVSQIGDNIINDFEGFLESQANLGAMGFNFDSNRLAQIAETGSDADLFNELRSQLANTGKDITKLKRSERLELESAYGINISDMLKMAGETPGGAGGEETKSPEELQKAANGILARIENLLGATGPIAVALGSLITMIGSYILTRKATSLLGGSTGRLGSAARGAGRGAGRVAGRVLAPATALYSGYSEYSKQKEDGVGTGTAITTGAVSAGATFAGAAVGMKAGASLGAFAGPVGIAVGGILFGIAGAFAGDKLASWTNENITKKFSSALDRAGKSVGNMWDSFTGWFDSKPKASKPNVSRGDDVVSQPGYGNRSLVTPSGVIALNNKDNIIAYADDLMGNTKLPFGSISNEFGKLDEFRARANKVFVGLGDTVTSKFQGVKQSIGNIFGASGEGLVGKFQQLSKSGSGFINNLKGNVLGKVQGTIGKFMGGGDGLLSKAPRLLTKIPGAGGILGKATSLLGGGGLKSIGTSILGKVGLGNIAGSLAGGPLTTITSLAAPLLKKIPVIGSALGKITDAPGKLIGSAVGKVGGFVKGLFGKKKPVQAASGAAGKLSSLNPAGLISKLTDKLPGGKFISGALKSFSPMGAVSKVAGLAKKIPGIGGLFGKKKPIQAVTGKASGLASGLAKKIPGVGRLLGKAALPLQGAFAAFDAYKGFTADKDATAGQKFKNAGSSVLSGLTFGLLGKNAGEIAASTTNRPAIAPTATSQLAAPIAQTPPQTAVSGLPPTVETTQEPPRQQPAQQTTVNIDFTRLENKLDQVIRAIGSMEVQMDGSKVGKILVNNSDAASTVAVFRQDARATL